MNDLAQLNELTERIRNDLIKSVMLWEAIYLDLISLNYERCAINASIIT